MTVFSTDFLCICLINVETKKLKRNVMHCCFKYDRKMWHIFLCFPHSVFLFWITGSWNTPSLRWMWVWSWLLNGPVSVVWRMLMRCVGWSDGGRVSSDWLLCRDSVEMKKHNRLWALTQQNCPEQRVWVCSPTLKEIVHSKITFI